MPVFGKKAPYQKFVEWLQANTTTTDTGCLVPLRGSGMTANTAGYQQARPSRLPEDVTDALSWTIPLSKNTRLKVTRIPLNLVDPESKLVASHICHNIACVNPEHVAYEDQSTNLSRNGCQPQHCRHNPKCVAWKTQSGTPPTTPKKIAETLGIKRKRDRTPEEAPPEEAPKERSRSLGMTAMRRPM